MNTAMKERAVLTLTEALLPRAMFDALPDYSCSLPTGKTIGKCWKRNTTHGTPGYSIDGPWLLGCYERLLPPDKRGRRRVLVRFRKIVVVE